MIRIAAIMLLAILAHTMLMTSRVDAGEHRSSSHVQSVTDAGPLFADPVHEPFCFSAQLVVKSSSTVLEPSDQATPRPNREPADVLPSQPYTSSPHPPPDIIRALLQVYRI